MGVMGATILVLFILTVVLCYVSCKKTTWKKNRSSGPEGTHIARYTFGLLMRSLFTPLESTCHRYKALQPDTWKSSSRDPLINSKVIVDTESPSFTSLFNA